SDMYEQWMREYKTPEKIEEKVRKEFVIGGHKAYAITRLMKKAEFMLLSSLDEQLVQMSLFTPVKSMEAALTAAFAKLGPKPSIILMPQGSLTVPVL
ncbi:MAG: nickel-dependent lactate racemase, partial [Sporomusa sp.]